MDNQQPRTEAAVKRNDSYLVVVMGDYGKVVAVGIWWETPSAEVAAEAAMRRKNPVAVAGVSW